MNNIGFKGPTRRNLNLLKGIDPKVQVTQYKQGQTGPIRIVEGYKNSLAQRLKNASKANNGTEKNILNTFIKELFKKTTKTTATKYKGEPFELVKKFKTDEGYIGNLVKKIFNKATKEKFRTDESFVKFAKNLERETRNNMLVKKLLGK